MRYVIALKWTDATRRSQLAHAKWWIVEMSRCRRTSQQTQIEHIGPLPFKISLDVYLTYSGTAFSCACKFHHDLHLHKSTPCVTPLARPRRYSAAPSTKTGS